jgi:hypothetical protein
MSDIKPGDLVMVVRPTSCCGDTEEIGLIFKVSAVENAPSWCELCGHQFERTVLATSSDAEEDCCSTIRLKKIDPPAEGDSLPTRREMGVAA